MGYSAGRPLILRNELIDSTTNLGALEPDVQPFSHGLRDFRNCIHPYQELSSHHPVSGPAGYARISCGFVPHIRTQRSP